MSLTDVFLPVLKPALLLAQQVVFFTKKDGPKAAFTEDLMI